MQCRSLSTFVRDQEIVSDPTTLSQVVASRAYPCSRKHEHLHKGYTLTHAHPTHNWTQAGTSVNPNSNRQTLLTCFTQLQQAQILDDISEFQTRSFIIKYRGIRLLQHELLSMPLLNPDPYHLHFITTDEFLDMNEGCQFQVLVPVTVGGDNGKFQRQRFQPTNASRHQQ